MVSPLTIRILGDAKSFSGSIDKSNNKMKSLGKFAVVAGAAMAAGLAVGGIAAVKLAIDFDKSFREVRTLLVGSGADIDALKNDILSLSAEMGITTKESIPALYQAISAGVPADNAIEFLRIASKASIAGVTDLRTAVDGLTSVTNAYGAENLSAQRASDLIFTTVKLGKTTVEELSGALFNVVPIAAATGIEFDQVAAALAALTVQGVPTTVATTQLRAAIQALSAPTSRQRKLMNELGLDFSAARLEQIGLSAAFKEAIGATGGNLEQLRKLIGSVEGLQAVLALGGDQSEVFDAALAAMQDSAGATDGAFEVMRKSTDQLWSALKVNLEVILIRIGSLALPLVNAALSHVIDALIFLNPYIERIGPSLRIVSDDLQDRFGPALQSITSLVISFVKAILESPPVQWIIDVSKSLSEMNDDGNLHPFLQWISDNKDTVIVVGSLAAGILATVVAFKSIVIVIATVVAKWALFKGAISGISLVLAGISWPILAVAAAIALVVAGAVLLISSGGDVEEAMRKVGVAFDVVWDKLELLKGKVGELVDWVVEQATNSENWEKLGTALVTAFGAALQFAKWAKDKFVDLVTWVVEQVTKTENWKALGTALVGAFGAALQFASWAKDKFADLVTWVVDQATNVDNWKNLGTALVGAFGPALDFVVWAVKKMDALIAWVILESTSLENWISLGKALVGAWGASLDFKEWAITKMADLVTWVIKQAFSIDNWKALGSAFVSAFGAALDFYTWAVTKWNELKTWVAETILDLVSKSETWAALGTALSRAITGSMDLLGELKAKWDAMIAGIPDLITKLREAIAALWSNMIPDISLPSVGGVVDAVTSLVPGFAHGGIVRATPGGSVIRVGEGGEDEAIVPLSRQGMGGDTNYYLTVYATDRSTGEEILDKLLEGLQRLQRRGSVAPGTVTS